MNMILQAIFNHGHKQNLDTAIIIDGLEHTYKDLYYMMMLLKEYNG